LTGGNLSVVTAMIGTPFELRTDGAILFLEEVQEEPFRIDRMLSQLRLAGKLRGLRGVLLGEFVRCEGLGANVRPLETIFREYFGDLGVPVLSGFPAGHVSDNVTLPIGARVRLDATAKKLELLEAPVETERAEAK
ncbi:MAG TPA: LD-carboxypeptidase, partial [Planctomycetota bacterium]|nr:LD-carboxypeptidase [Planctomycetota bacterium]